MDIQQLNMLRDRYDPNQVFKSQAATAPSQPQKKLGGIPGVAANFLPTIGGAIGAVGGTILAPVAGTAAGGALGAGLGEYLRQKLTGEEQDGIDKGNIVQEGIFGALPGVGKGLKAVSTAKKAAGGIQGAGGLRGVLTGGKLAKATGMVDELAGAGKATAQTTETAMQARKPLVKRIGERLSGESVGIKVDKNLYGVESATRKSQVASKFTGPPRQQLTKMKTEVANLGKQVEDVLTKSKAPISGTDVNKSIFSAINDPSIYVDLDLSTPSAQKTLASFQAKFATADSPSKVNAILKEAINPKAVAAEKKLVAGKNITQAENAIIAAKRAADEILGSIPEVKSLKQQMAQIYDLAPDVAAAANKAYSAPFTGGSVKLKAPAQIKSAVQSYIGAGLQKGIGTDIPGVAATSSFIGRTARAAIPQAGYRVAGMGAGIPFNGAVQQEQTDPGAGLEGTTAADLPAQDITPQTGSDSPFSGANIETNVQKILANGGTMKEVTEYLNIVKTMQALQPSGGKGRNSAASAVIADTKTGLKTLQGLSDEITNSSANVPFGVGWLRGKNPLDTNAQNLQSSIATAKQIVGKALEGGVLRKEDEVKYAKILPTMNDTDAVAQDKIRKLTNLISSRLAEYQAQLNGGDGGVDLSALTAGAAL
jgi:hypothetical protein